MESFYFQLVCSVGLLGLVGFFIYKKKKEVAKLSEELLDKKIVIIELAEHANRMEKEVNSVVEIRPLATPKKRAAKTDKYVKPKKEKVVKSKKITKTKK
jgi:hypothetical protein